ncbi:hypothetical protein [Ochrobactrum quorumnocens]|uniref:hypothetical protein n=1 Tax=Ochrobactrum quorumnocens TaxID=271865 RepID=UPI000A8ADD77|nr:hypothetical protein [[Ochrobactrum] quorumnocens]
MPFRNAQYQGTFRPAELVILQKAYEECCVLLDRCLTGHEDKDRVARAIIREFERGIHDPVKIAEQVAIIETHVSVTSSKAHYSDTTA